MDSAFRKKTVLVTGATGLLGSYLIKRFRSMRDVRVIALSRNRTKLEALFGDYTKENYFSIIDQDASLPLQEFDYPIDYIFHAASPISGAVIDQTPVDVIVPNVIGTKNYLDFLLRQKKIRDVDGRLLLFSSATVYANTTNQDRTVTEEETSVADVLDAPNAPYSESKRLVEVMAKAYYKQYGIESVVARFSYLYGYSHFPAKTAFYEFITKAMHGQDIVLNNSDVPRRDNIYVEDAIEGLLRLAIYGKAAESYNISSNGDLENFMAVDEMAYVIARIVNKYFGKNVSVIYRNKVNGIRKPGILLDNTKMKKLGWKVEFSMEKSITETILAYAADVKE